LSELFKKINHQNFGVNADQKSRKKHALFFNETKAKRGDAGTK